ncbi:MAG TPA: ParB/RepB/Spo0J family partition protein [Candidatus Binataceae bacterium]|nr:ParB/RepB/Spo0J family partition protein [Candidatus Binataceae bacterium]
MTRRSLGRGLDALLQVTDGVDAAGGLAAPDELGGAPAAGSGGLVLVAVERIAAGRFQPRVHFEPQALEDLAAAIKAQGIIEPLIVRPAGKDHELDYELIAGERRLRAARMAGLAAVPVIVRALDDRAALELSLVENLLREDLNVVEEGRAFARLNDEFDLTHEEIAERIGKSRSYVSNIIRLVELPAEVLEMVGRRELTSGQVRPLLALSSPEAQLAEARKMAAAKTSSRQAEAFASARRSRRPRAGAQAVDANLAALGAGLQRTFKRKVRFVMGRGKAAGRVELEFYGEQDLIELVRLLGAAARSVSASV